MNINSPNLLTLLSGATSGSDSINPMLNTASGSEVGDFAQALIAEIGHLQNTGVQGLPLPFQGLDTLSEESLQDIAALFGNSLPVPAKLDQAIDLEETLASLKDVLQHIEAAIRPDSASISDQKQLLDPDRADKPDTEDVDNILQWFSENLTAQATEEVPALLAHSIEPAMTTGVVGDKEYPSLTQEIGAIQAEADKTVHDLIQKQILNDQIAQSESAGTQIEKTIDEVKMDGVPIDAMRKTALSEHKPAEWAGDKHRLEIAAEMAPLSKRPAIDAKPEIPAMTRPFAHPEWKQELGERILWMNNKTLPFAELRLNPQHLGPISIRINMMDQDQASIAFSAQHASVREAIEGAVPKLREMLGSQHLNLAEVNISQPPAFDQGKSPGYGQMAQQHQGQGRQNQGDGTGAFDHNGHLADLAEEAEGVKAVVSKGLLSFFA